MTSTVFVPQVTVIKSTWLNDVNQITYNLLGNGTVIPSNGIQASTNMGLIPNLGRVVMVPNAAGTWQVFGPQGQVINIASSTTSGLQEAINTACTGNGTQGYDLEIQGWETTSGIAGPVITCTTPITFPPMEQKSIRAGSVLINFTSAIGTANAMTFNSMVNVDVYMPSTVISSSGTIHVVEVTPSAATPGTSVSGVNASRIHIGTIQSSTASTLFEIDSSNFIIQNTSFYIKSLNGLGGGSDGITLIGGSGGVYHCDVTCPSISNLTGYGILVGSLGKTKALYNNVSVGVSPVVTTSSTAVGVYGQQNNITFTCDATGAGSNSGLILYASAAQNVFRVGQNGATTAVNDGSTTQDNEGMYGSYKPRAYVNSAVGQTVAYGTPYNIGASAGTVIYNTGAAWNNTTAIFTPGRPGYVDIKVQCNLGGVVSTTSLLIITVFQNGSSTNAISNTAIGAANGYAGGNLSAVVFNATAAGTISIQIELVLGSGTSTAPTLAAGSFVSFALIDG